MQRVLILAASLLAFAGPARGQTDPASLPARDHHEGLLIAADPYLDSARAKEKFGKANPLPGGIVPVEVYLRNETTEAMRINLDTVRLVLAPPGGSRQRLEPLDSDEVASLIAHPGGAANPEGPRSRWPRRIPTVNKDKKTKELQEILRPLALDVSLIPPLATLHGFVFFNLNGDFNLLQSATLYVPDVKRVAADRPLTYFEIDLRAAARP